MSFESLDVNLITALHEMHFQEPTLIQKRAIPSIINGKSLLVKSRTGTGKTAAYAIPILNRLAKNKNDKSIIVVPTREIAIQVYDTFDLLNKYLKLKINVIYGGQSRSDYNQTLNANILISTPGRLLEFQLKKKLQISAVNKIIIVFDEADRLLDTSLHRQSTSIIESLPVAEQFLFFSATISDKLKQFCNSLPQRINFIEDAKNNQRLNIKEKLYVIDKKNKFQLLHKILNTNNFDTGIIFVKTKKRVNYLVDFLKSKYISCEGLHSDYNQKDRIQILNQFRNKEMSYLVVTDLLARGIDISNLSVVINVDLPVDPETYTHRIGRTGRLSTKGKSISLVSADEADALFAIEKYIKSKFIRYEDNDYPIEHRLPLLNKKEIRQKKSLIYPKKDNDYLKSKTSHIKSKPVRAKINLFKK